MVVKKLLGLELHRPSTWMLVLSRGMAGDGKGNRIVHECSVTSRTS